jgi:hypothetical protein
MAKNKLFLHIKNLVLTLFYQMEAAKKSKGAVTRSKREKTSSLSSIKRLELGNHELNLVDKELAEKIQQD